MSSYYLVGYEPPAGVTNASAVKEWQRTLGVTVDGVWGPKTQEAYVSYMSRSGQNGNPLWAPTPGGSAFDSYYQAILNGLRAPSVSVPSSDVGALRDQWSAILRPAADEAIKRREEMADETIAELDADAVSRGMGRSSYVSSIKERERREAADDISQMEAQYGAALAQRVYESMEKYAQMRLTAEQYNATAAANWQRNNQLPQTSASRSSGGSGASGQRSPSGKLTLADYTEYLNNLSPEQRRQLFNSELTYWSARREELYSALGSETYSQLRRQYGG